jgi:hypothetical protein
MSISFSDLPDNSKIWIFPSSRKFYESELPVLMEEIQSFMDDWTELDCGFELDYDRFIIIGVDTSEATLQRDKHDALTLFIQKLEADYDVTLLDRINVCYKQGKFVQYKDLIEFKKMLKAGAVSKKTIIFDNMITEKQYLEYDWEIPITESWLNRFLK